MVTKWEIARQGEDEEGPRPNPLPSLARKYFQLHRVPNELRVDVARMYLKGKADIWSDEFIASYLKADRHIFSEELCRRFAKATAREVEESFSKIKQLGS